MSWEVFVKAVLHAYTLHVRGHTDSVRRFERVACIEMARLAIQTGESRPLLELLLSYRGLEASLPEDKVFALCGLATDAGRDGLDVQIDYRSDMSAVYQDLAVRMLNSQPTLDVLSVPRAGSASDLPSWVPDWSSPTTVLSLRTHGPESSPLLDFNASSNNAKQPRPPIQLRHGKISLHSHTIDHIAHLGLPYSNDTSTVTTYWVGLLQGWRSVAALGSWQSLVSPHSAKTYAPTQQPLMETYAQILIAGFSKGASPEVLRSEFEAWYSISHELQSIAYRPLYSILTLHAFTGFWRYVRTMAGMVGGDEKVEKLLGWRTRMAFANNRRLVVTDKGFIGLEPAKCRVGDEIVIARGGAVPLVLRRTATGGGDDNTMQLVGDAYVQGIMHGEAFDEQQCREIWIA